MLLPRSISDSNHKPKSHTTKIKKPSRTPHPLLIKTVQMLYRSTQKICLCFLLAPFSQMILSAYTQLFLEVCYNLSDPQTYLMNQLVAVISESKQQHYKTKV